MFHFNNTTRINLIYNSCLEAKFTEDRKIILVLKKSIEI